VSTWLSIWGLPIPAASLEEGSPLDALIFAGLIGVGMYVLNRRNLNWPQIIQQNGWLFAFLAYCLIAVLWSDYPFVAFKRWTKVIGLPVMALILFVEPDFDEAFRTLMKRSAYVLLPVSVLFIKYYTGLGTKYDHWSGEAMYTGIATDKNMLGLICLIFGLFFVWHWLNIWPLDRSRERRNELILTAGFLLMALWLIRLAHSATSLVAFVIGSAIMVFVGLRSINLRQIGVYALLVLVSFAVAQATFGIWTYILEILHKDSTLTDRTLLWADIFKVQFNPILGTGFESFWLGDRLTELHAGRRWQPNEAHNGYLETYINLGLVGLSLLVGMLIATFSKVRLALLRDFQFGRFRLAFFVAVVLYNLAEVSFRGPHPLWLVFYIIAFDFPRPIYEESELFHRERIADEELELAQLSGPDYREMDEHRA
jgi:O-antigen ligase